MIRTVQASTGAVEWRHADQQGTVIAATNAAGNVFRVARLSPFGELVNSGAATMDYIGTYQGQQYACPTGPTAVLSSCVPM